MEEKGYKDEIKNFYPEKEIPNLLKEAISKNMSPSNAFEGRAYIVWKDLPDAPAGTVLRPAIGLEGKPSKKPEYKDHYCYGSKYRGRNSFLHREIVEGEKDWFVRIK